ncbi:OsmC family protein [Treponema putidum]|uniref:OsmC family peroxiredoxin n=1 Tax=Treponema putidum TaxID=221027 RepID=A0AAE9SL63_9SPIR|nr:OsmC family protein [Treponema putidum]UTY28483.1 OsmC family peroxiredoxin [Treponema putidum]UTY30933.1 OsmC family peroxiredoxin [Treponema putidum]UTY33349.1 OsmC family peroxiredoxin [Treponema putidum]
MAKEFRTKSEIDLGEGFKVECEASGKKVIADEPLSFGGTDLGMNPIELLLSGLGACKCVTSKVIAKKNGLKLDYLAVECIGFFRPEKLGLSDIETIYHIKSDASDEELEKFMALVDDSCPVHATIKNSAPIAHKLIRV